jgi:hypothetical protein
VYYYEPIKIKKEGIQLHDAFFSITLLLMFPQGMIRFYRIEITTINRTIAG